MGAGKGNVIVNSKSPSNKELITKVEEKDHKYYAKIYPNEIGNFNSSKLFPIIEQTSLQLKLTIIIIR